MNTKSRERRRKKKGRVPPHTEGAVKVTIPPANPGGKERTRWYSSEGEAQRALRHAMSYRNHGRKNAIRKLLISQLLDQQTFRCFFCRHPFVKKGWKLSHYKDGNGLEVAVLACSVCLRKGQRTQQASRISAVG